MSRTRHVLILILVIFIALATMMEIRARGERDLARSAIGHDSATALKHYARCLSWYVPFGTAETAAEEMLTLGEKWLDQGQINDAYLALSRMKAGLYGARWLIVPRQDLLDKAEPLLARIQAMRKLGENGDPAKIETLSKKYLAQMQTPLRPSTGSALAATMGFLAWIAGAIWFIRRRHGRDSWQWKDILPPVILFSVGYIVWLWGMTWA